MPDTPILTPVSDHERIATLDILRAVALLGVFLINMEYFTRPLKAYAYGIEPRLSGVNYAIAWTEHVLMRGNFWTMFALLLGMGFAVMCERAERAGRDFLIQLIYGPARVAFGGMIVFLLFDAQWPPFRRKSSGNLAVAPES